MVTTPEPGLVVISIGDHPDRSSVGQVYGQSKMDCIYFGFVLGSNFTCYNFYTFEVSKMLLIRVLQCITLRLVVITFAFHLEYWGLLWVLYSITPAS